MEFSSSFLLVLLWSVIIIIISNVHGVPKAKPNDCGCAYQYATGPSGGPAPGAKR